MQLQDFIISYDSFLSAESCDSLVAAFEQRIDYVKRYESNEYKFDQLFLGDCDLASTQSELAQYMIPYFQDYFKRVNLDQYIGVQSFENFRIKKYYKNTDYEFKPHIDVSDLASSKRYLVAILYLNDNNGSTTFPQLGFESKPERGKLILFPPMWQYLHAGVNPTDNDKYIMMTYLNYQ